MPNKPGPPYPGFLSQIPVVGPVWDLGGKLLGVVNAQGKFIQAAGSLAGNVGQKVVKTEVKNLLPTGWENWILRLGEIMLGIVLIGVGVAKLTGADNFIMKTATKAGKAAILA